MSVLEAILLGILQGLTEFLPISSSGHLQLVTWFAGWEPFEGDASLWTAFEVALHVGTLAGVLAYFGREVAGLIAAGARQVVGRQSLEGRRAWLLVLATVPAGIVGVAAGSALERNERVWVTGCTLALFGVWLWWADRRSATRPDAVLGGSGALALGVAQALALVPGVSRSGAIMTAARLRGHSRLEVGPGRHVDERAGDRRGGGLQADRPGRLVGHPRGRAGGVHLGNRCGGPVGLGGGVAPRGARTPHRLRPLRRVPRWPWASRCWCSWRPPSATRPGSEPPPAAGRIHLGRSGAGVAPLSRRGRRRRR